MSAFIVDAEHIHVLLWAGLQVPNHHDALRWYFGNPTDRHELTTDTADAVGQMLVNENRNSVNYHYNNDPGAIEYSFAQPMHNDWSTTEVLKAIHCYEHQASDAPKWHTSEAHAFCKALERHLIETLPDYHKAPWAITAEGADPHPSPGAPADTTNAAQPTTNPWVRGDHDPTMPDIAPRDGAGINHRPARDTAIPEQQPPRRGGLLKRIRRHRHTVNTAGSVEQTNPETT